MCQNYKKCSRYTEYGYMNKILLPKWLKENLDNVEIDLVFYKWDTEWSKGVKEHYNSLPTEERKKLILGTC